MDDRSNSLSDNTPNTLQWRVHLARRQPLRALIAVLAMLGSAAWSLYLFHSLLAPLASVTILTGALAEFLFPVQYTLSPGGAEARGWLYWRRITWQEVKRIQFGEQAVKLSPLAHPSPREAFRGVVLRCNENRDLVLATVRYLCNGEGSSQ